jgi:outer membrane immunogenic protein
LLAGSSILLAATAANAGGAYRGSIKDGPYEHAFSWTGFYVGGNVGGGWGDADWTFLAGSRTSHDLDGGVGGVHAGYNYQFSPNLVAGIEADFTWSGMDGSSLCPSGVHTCVTEVNNFGSVRGRLGFAAHRLLVYATAGFAWGDIDAKAVPIGGGVTQSYDVSDRTGWVAGLGTEYAFAHNWIIGVEWKHYDFGDETGRPMSRSRPTRGLPTTLRSIPSLAVSAINSDLRTS